jgi:hypothetical protein
MTGRRVAGDVLIAAPRTIARPGGAQARPARGKCGSCEKVGGGHRPSCPLLRPRACRGCSVEIGHRSRRQYCPACERSRCPECRASPGKHKRSCRYTQRKRRPRLTVVQDIVTEDVVLDLYLAHGPAAVRLASRVLRTGEAADIVHDVFVYLLAKRRYLREIPTRGYLFQAVRHGALRTAIRYWSRFTPTLEELQSLQSMLAPDEEPVA